MPLPIRTTLEDIDAICTYLATKPTGVTLAEAKTVLGSQRLDGRKLSALKFWGLLSDSPDDRLILTPTGRELAKGGAWRTSALLRRAVQRLISSSINRLMCISGQDYT